jgi:hypothetical protein
MAYGEGGVAMVMKMFRTGGLRSGCLLAALLFAVALTGCSSVVSTQVSTFRSPGELGERGSVAVQAMHADLNRSLEFAWYRTQVETALAKLGYQVGAAAETADYIALLDYGVEPVESDRSGPFVTTGLGWGRSRYFGTNLVIVDDDRRQEFIRRVQLVIERNGPDGERVYEVSGASQGRCGVMSVVFDEMLAAMLQGFPVANASVKTIQVKGDARC